MKKDSNNQALLKAKIQKLLGEEITLFILKGKGACNNAYYVESLNGGKYIVKQERDHKEFQPQNTLVVEAGFAQKLYDLKLSIPTPRIRFVSKNPDMYGYDYIEGEMLIDVWPYLSKEEKIKTCNTLGNFHAEIGKKFTKDMAKTIGVTIDTSSNLHPEVEKEYGTILASPDVPDEFKDLAKRAKTIFDQTLNLGIFQCIHNDSHHENILMKNKNIAGIIDFGEAMYGEIAKEFSRYIRDYPDYVEYIISAYEKASGNKLSHKRLISNALLSGLAEIIDDYRKGGDERIKALQATARYRDMIVTPIQNIYS